MLVFQQSNLKSSKPTFVTVKVATSVMSMTIKNLNFFKIMLNALVAQLHKKNNNLDNVKENFSPVRILTIYQYS